MSDISIPGVSSKYNTTKLIDDLVAAERIRLTKMEENVASLETTQTTWRQVNRDFGDLQRSVKTLYGFENPFSEKIATSSDEKVLTATATRVAPFDSYSISVKNIATSDRFITPSMSRSYKVEPGDYTFGVGEDTVTLRYRGGTVEDFAKRLSEKATGLIRATTVRDTSETQVLMIEAIPTGAKNRLIFQDDARTLGLQTGMLQVARGPEGSVSLDSVMKSPVNSKGTPAASNSVSLSENGILVRPGGSVRLPFTKEVALERGMVLEFRYRTVDYEDKDLAPPQPPGPTWPVAPEGRFQGLVVNGAPNAFPVPEGKAWNIPERVDNPNVLAVESSGTQAALPPLAASPEFKVVRVDGKDLPGSISALVLNNGNTHRAVEIADIRLFDPARQGDLEPVNPVGTAGDALIEFRGIEARRSSNSIDDLVDGITINLKRSSRDPVDLDITPDTKAAKEGIIRFVFTYNQLLTKILVLTSDNPAIIDELEYLTDDQRADFKDLQGTMRGDTSLNQVKNRLQGIVTSPYSTRAGKDLALLAQIGISTNASSGNSGGSLNFSKLRGYLEIDEGKLDTFLQSNIDAVKDLFGKDTTGDLVINSGVARAVDEYLTPYTQTGGFVSTRIARIDGQIDSTKDDISDYEDHLKDYEANLKRQYGIMEATLGQLENSSRDLQNFSNQQNSNR